MQKESDIRAKCNGLECPSIHVIPNREFCAEVHGVVMEPPLPQTAMRREDEHVEINRLTSESIVFELDDKVIYSLNSGNWVTKLQI